MRLDTFGHCDEPQGIASPQTLVLAGPQGSGKGTQAENLQRVFGYDHFEMGGKLRQIAQEDTPLGREVKEAQMAGKFVDFEVVMRIVTDYLRTRGNLDRAMFDGIPRNIEQEWAFTGALEDRGFANNTRMVLFDVPRQAAMRNIVYRGVVTGRKDDQDPVAVNERLRGFYTKTMEAVAAYERRGQLLRVDATPEVNMIRATNVARRIMQLQMMRQSGIFDGHDRELHDLLSEQQEIDWRLERSKQVVFERLLDVLGKA